MITLLLRLLPVGEILLLVAVVLGLQMARIDVIGMALGALGLSEPLDWFDWL